MFEVIILGLLQGLTEFLPVSSSGHLVIAQAFLPHFKGGELALDVFLHGGTLLAVLLWFRGDIVEVLRGLLPGGEPPKRRLAFVLMAASLPVFIIGYLFESTLTELFSAPGFAASMLLVTGTMLWLSESWGRGSVPLERVGYGRGVLIGFAQATAILPGISRSGSTISVALFAGVKGEDAARFSFLLSIPAVTGALLYKALGMSFASAPILEYLVGVIVSFGTGLLAIRFLMAAIKRGRLRWFSIYCWALGMTYLLFVPR
ncbi:MAG: UDP-diphosphatase [Deltaproteobacteria bacterium]|nr:MAG: UDP-diphosphatase [Deltaproteobacteria bacterium]